MEALCFYYHDHELKNVNRYKYGFADFFKLPEDPVTESSFVRAGKEINILKLDKIYGTCIAKNKNKSTVTLLTPTGVVEIKFRKEYFTMFDKRISERGEDGAKHIVEKSWFDRGSMIVVMGFRSGDTFIVKKYAKDAGHQLYKIDEVMNNGDVVLRHNRYKGEEEEDG
jgi:DNA polymerase-3 subunit alpha